MEIVIGLNGTKMMIQMNNNIDSADVFISGNIPSLKNSKVKTSKGIFPSKTVVNFLRANGVQHYSSKDKTVKGYVSKPDLFKPYVVALKKAIATSQPPFKLQFYFVRKTKSRFDFGNSVEILADMFTAYDLWEDDNSDCFLPFPWVIDNSCYTVNKDNPGVYIKVIK